MNYYRILDDIYFKNRWQLDMQESSGREILPFEFRKGRVFPFKDKLIAKVDFGISLDFTLSLLAVPIASSKLVKILSKYLKDEVQLIPISIEGKKEPYYIINVLKLYDCLDEKRSIFMKWTEKDHRADLAGEYRMVAKLRIDKLKANNSNIFRIKRWSIALIVSKLIKNEIEKNDMKGVVFEKEY